MNREFGARCIPARWAGGLCLLGSVLGLSGCQSIAPTSPDAAQVRFIDVSTDSPELDVYMNGNGTAYGLGYGAATSYVGVTPGKYTIGALRANTSQGLVTGQATFAGTRQYTAVVSNTLASLQETVYPDQSVPAPTGMVSVRVLDAAAVPGPVDVYLVAGSGALATTTPLMRNLTYTGDGGYVNVPADASYSVAVLPAGGAPSWPNVLLSHGATVSAGSGAVRTVILSDAPAGASKSMAAFVVDDLDTP